MVAGTAGEFAVFDLILATLGLRKQVLDCCRLKRERRIAPAAVLALCKENRFRLEDPQDAGLPFEEFDASRFLLADLFRRRRKGIFVDECVSL